MGYDGIKLFVNVEWGMMVLNLLRCSKHVTTNEQNPVSKSSKSIHVYSETADLSMKQAAREVKEAVSKMILSKLLLPILVSFDGTWQKKGYTPFTGVVTAMSDQGKCIDLEIKSEVCKSCQYLKNT